MKTTAFVGLLLLLPACVSKKKFQELESTSRKQLNQCQEQLSALRTNLQELEAGLEKNLATISALKTDTAQKAMNISRNELLAADLNRKLSECEAEQRIRLNDFNQEISRKNQTLQQKKY